MNKLIPVFYILLLSACVSAPKYGFGPVELTSDQQKFYDKYLNRINNRKNKKEAWAFAFQFNFYLTFSNIPISPRSIKLITLIA